MQHVYRNSSIPDFILLCPVNSSFLRRAGIIAIIPLLLSRHTDSQLRNRTRSISLPQSESTTASHIRNTRTHHIRMSGSALAFYGFSYWGIATQSLTYLIVVTLCSWHFSSWRPTLHIDFSPLKPLFSFGSKILITNIANQINNNILSVVLGKFFTSQSVGNYNQANKWNATGHQFITGMLNSVAQPILVKVRDDQERELRVFRKILRFVAFIAFPAMFGLSTVTRELILITVGEKWTGSISLMQLLCIGGAFIPISTLFSNLIISQGKSNIYMWNIISQVVLQLITVLCIIMMKGSIPNNGDSLCMYQYHMAVCLAHLCPSIHRS